MNEVYIKNNHILIIVYNKALLLSNIQQYNILAYLLLLLLQQHHHHLLFSSITSNQDLICQNIDNKFWCVQYCQLEEHLSRKVDIFETNTRMLKNAVTGEEKVQQQQQCSSVNFEYCSVLLKELSACSLLACHAITMNLQF